jgi:hypothetical protein
MTENTKPEEPTAQSHQDRQHALDRKRYTVEKTTLFFLFVYVIFSGYQGCEMKKSVDIAHDTYVAANRPYIGVNTFQLAYFGEDKILRDRATKDTKAFAFKAEIKNFGPVPGSDFVGSWKGFLNGAEIKGTKIPDNPSILFPSQVAYLTHTVFEPDYTALMNGQKTLAVEITVEYKGPSGTYKYCERHQYAADVNGFINLGACTQ